MLEGYATGIDKTTAQHPRTVLALDRDGQPLPPGYGYPSTRCTPTQLGCKNPKHIKAIFESNSFNQGCREDQGCNWFGGG
ncbi:molybdopterin-dependent oxidoreductase [Comamonas sp.]|uniref:molybdopterin-dependent oxidoreductase n=1 Tax=Comamonas sp. TaxID=34028 RepID=UPI0025BFA46D|nr:molybdopterin-dependent oxidoreductase [Comamonas sp.]